ETTAHETDAGGLAGSKTPKETVNDIAPTVTITSLSPTPALVGQSVTVTFTATDDEAISKTCINWGDGTAVCQASPAAHSYVAAGRFGIKVNATDHAGVTDFATMTENVTVAHLDTCT